MTTVRWFTISAAHQAHLKPIKRTNRDALKVFDHHIDHVAARERGLSTENDMTMLNNTSGPLAASTGVRDSLRSGRTWLGRLVNGLVATVIAHREYQANLAMLRQFTDRELADIGLHRNDICGGLSEAAKLRSEMQRLRFRA
jgi:uncharacterized protein YjiS (DUF1127 family)